MKRHIGLFIEDIIESIRLIEVYIRDTSKENFGKDIKLRDSVTRRLEIIGEAVKNIPDKIRENYPQIPWKMIAGLRDIIIHSYFDIDFEITWDIIKKDIPDLKKNILKIKNDLNIDKSLK